MKHHYGNYLGICINNNDPEYRGRVQVFVPHIMPALYEGWNELGEDIKLECVGNNLPNGLSSKVVEKLTKILPWAEAAMPVIGNSVAGSYNPETGNFNQTNTPEAAAESSTSGAPFTPDVFGGSFTAELNDPNVRNKLFNLMEAEVGSQGPDAQLAFMETVRNRAAVRGVSIDKIISDTRYYEPYQTGAINRAAARLTDTKRSSFSNIINAALAGSNITNGATHNASAGVAASVRQGGFDSVTSSVKEIGGETFYSKTFEQNKLSSLLQKTQAIKLTDPASGPDASAAGATRPPFSQPEPTSYLDAQPNQSAVTQVNAPTPVTVGGFDKYFNGEGFAQVLRARGNQRPAQVPDKRGDLVWKSKDGNGSTLCAAGALITAGVALDNSTIKTGGVGTASNLARSSNNSLTNSGLYTRTSFNPAGYTPQNGDVVALANNGSGHALTYLNGKWYAHKAGDMKPEQHIATGRYPGEKTLYRLNEDGVAALDKAGIADGSAVEALVEPYDSSDLDGIDDFGRSQLVKNTTETTAVTLDTTGMAQGMFGIPGPGAMLWVFFREGDPQFPVYFAASYGAAEWQSAYRASSPPAYGPQENSSKTISNQTVFRPNNAGAITFTGAIDVEKDSRAVRMAHDNGGYLELHPYGTVHYSPNEHLEQVAGTSYKYCLNREEWTQGDDNRVTIGNQWVVIGNPSQANIETIEKLTEKVKQINAEMMKN